MSRAGVTAVLSVVAVVAIGIWSVAVSETSAAIFAGWDCQGSCQSYGHNGLGHYGSGYEAVAAKQQDGCRKKCPDGYNDADCEDILSKVDACENYKNDKGACDADSDCYWFEHVAYHGVDPDAGWCEFHESARSK